MLTTQDVRRFEETVAALERPVLSLYLDVNPGQDETSPRAAVVRARETLRELDVPGEVVQRVVRHLDGRTKPARTLAIFATDTQLHTLPLQVSLPVRHPATGHLEARYGEPYLLPLELALDEYPPYGVVYADSENWRFFHACLGEFEEVVDAFRAVGPENYKKYNEADERNPAYQASRSDAGKDNLKSYLDDWTHRFYRETGRLLQQMVDEHGCERIVLFGSNTPPRDFTNVLPKSLKERIVATLPSLTSPGASPGEVRQRFDQVVEDIEREQEQKLLTRLREEGVTGLGRCLTALQDSRLYLLAVPWQLDATVWRNRETGYVAADRSDARRRSPNGDGHVEALPLRDILLDLTRAHAVRLDLMRGENERRLVELGGMAGLARW
jgi:hypothetical protein